MLKKVLLTTIILVLGITSAVQSNPYSLYRQGNCTYFAYECIERFWPIETPNIPRIWNACNWVNLIGYTDGSYMIVQAPEPQPNDLYIIPAGKGESRGHIGLIVAIGKHYDFEAGEVSDYCMAYESAMFPDDPSFKYKVGRCKYRLFCYEKSWL